MIGPIRTAAEASLVANALASVSATTPHAALKALDAPRIVDGEAGKTAFLTSEETDEFWEAEIARANAVLDASFGPARPRTERTGPRALSATDLREGLSVVAVRDIHRFGSYRATGSVAAGSLGVVEEVREGGVAIVEFADAETGERVRGDVYSWELGKMAQAPRPAYDPWADDMREAA